MLSKTPASLKFEFDIVGDGFPERCSAEVLISHHSENYGEDADGNRGMLVEIVDDVKIERVFSPEGVALIGSLPPGMEEVITEEAKKYIKHV